MLCMENFPQAVLALAFLCLEGGSLVVAQLGLRGMVGMNGLGPWGSLRFMGIELDRMG